MGILVVLIIEFVLFVVFVIIIDCMRKVVLKLELELKCMLYLILNRDVGLSLVVFYVGSRSKGYIIWGKGWKIMFNYSVWNEKERGKGKIVLKLIYLFYIIYG